MRDGKTKNNNVSILKCNERDAANEGALEGDVSNINIHNDIFWYHRDNILDNKFYAHVLANLCRTFGYILLVFQTVYVLNSREPKYINLRHIALKWLVCIFLHLIKQNFSFNHDINSQMTVILLDLLIIAVAYPSRALKAVHLKYFAHKEQQRYQ